VPAKPASPKKRARTDRASSTGEDAAPA